MRTNYLHLIIPQRENVSIRIIPYILITLLAGMVLSCETRIEVVPKSDLLTLPSKTARDFMTVLTDSGQLQLIMSAPVMEEFSTDIPFIEFRSGISVDFYDGQEAVIGSVTAKYAKYTNSTNIWELKDSVIVINEQNDKLETEVLFWDQDKDLIYSERFVKITNEDEIIMGTGFESDPHLENRRIKKVTATIYLKDEE